MTVTGNQRLSGGRSSVGRALDCGSGGRGFKPHRSPHFSLFRLLMVRLVDTPGKVSQCFDSIWAVSSAGRAGDS
jgi:hypothetical protein